ncbi:MAG: acetyl-CoA carboxylase carboxyltransferase subunit alpha [Cytophagia bacterium]|nr:acetyl-CoA carboxylase carboxyltransferase subunit alpha [Cytophagia bacterium]
MANPPIAIPKSETAWLDFEKPIQELEEELSKLRQIQDKGKSDVSGPIRALETQILKTKKQLYSQLTGWQKVQLSRHLDRPYTLFYVEHMTTDFVELHGDRCYGDDKAIVGGFAKLDGQSVMFIGHQKGINTKMRQYRNFGMANPEGYRKALRLMKLAEKFNKPVVTLVDTPGAFPGIEAEERGQAEAIAKNIREMFQLKVPVVVVIVGEGASGGAIGIGVGDRVLMLENTWYSVISPESCSSILWRSWDHKEKAAEALQLTADAMLKHGLIDEIVPEPLGGAHRDREGMAKTLKSALLRQIKELQAMDPSTRIQKRIERFSSMGVYGHES